MIVRRPDHPVARPKVLLGALLLLAYVAGVVALSEHLRHPHPVEGVPLEQLEHHLTDPRDPPDCPEPAPREGDPADAPVLGPRATPPMTVTSGDLVDCPAYHDGHLVRYRGEIVGAIMIRGSFAWIQVNDDIYADAGPLPTHAEFLGGNAGVGVLLPVSATRVIERIGGPHTQGDVVEVVGRFQRIDDETREVAVIRASTLEVVQPGTDVWLPIQTDRLVAALLLVPLAGSAVTLQIIARRRSWTRPGA
jgi:hypothetical protein